jgi:hypothetical protein
MTQNIKLGGTARQALLDSFIAAGKTFEASNYPVISTAALSFRVTEPHPVAGPTMAHLVADEGQELTWFNYKSGDLIDDGLGGQRKATRYDTTLTRERRVPAGRSMSVEAISLSASGRGIRYPASVLAEETVNDRVVRAFYIGDTNADSPLVSDPSSLATPPEIDSPANLEDVLAQAVFPALSFMVEWNGQNKKDLGNLDQVPEGAARSYRRSNGTPEVGNRYIIPEGLLWRGENSGTNADQELIFLARLQRAVVIPINLPRGLLGTAPDQRPVPTFVAVHVRMRLQGMQIGAPSVNA